MNINFNKNGDNLNLVLEGRLDTTTAPKLDDFLKDNLMGEKDIITYRSIAVDNSGMRE